MSRGCIILSTSDLINWNTIEPPPNTSASHGLFSHDDHLFFLSYPPASHDPDQHLVLFKFSESPRATTSHVAPSASTWTKLPNARCPIKQWVPAMFASEYRLVLAGGKDGHGSLSNVTEYCLKSHQWLEPTHWPTLPFPVQQQCVVMIDSYVHLLGGLVVSEGKASSRPTSALSLRLENNLPSGEWKRDVLPTLPLPSPGACSFSSSVVVAGGGKPGEWWNDVFILEKKSEKWLRLPPLKKARNQPTLIIFRDRLLAFGGWTLTGSWCGDVEQLVLNFD